MPLRWVQRHEQSRSIQGVSLPMPSPVPDGKVLHLFHGREPVRTDQTENVVIAHALGRLVHPTR